MSHLSTSVACLKPIKYFPVNTKRLFVKMKNPLIEFKTRLERSGYCVVPNVFTQAEIADFIQMFDAAVERASADKEIISQFNDNILVKGDLPGQAEMASAQYFVFNPKIVSVVRELLGPSITYFGESNMQSGIGDRGFHSDNRMTDRESPRGADWKGSYDIIRVALYLHPSDKCSGGVKIVPGSHKRATNKFYFRHKNILARTGDLVIWKLTTTHSGNAVVPRFFKSLSLHPRIESALPAWCFVPNPMLRRSLFMVYGVPGEHLQRYIEYFNSREDYVEYQKYSGFSGEISELARRVGVDLVHPHEEFGVLRGRR